MCHTKPDQHHQQSLEMVGLKVTPPLPPNSQKNKNESTGFPIGPGPVTKAGPVTTGWPKQRESTSLEDSPGRCLLGSGTRSEG